MRNEQQLSALLRRRDDTQSTRRQIRGFDYRAGVPCARTAREWREIRAAILEGGGHSKWHRGELWLFDNKLAFVFEVYMRDANRELRAAKLLEVEHHEQN
jgi:hypothetical protein